MAVVVIDTIKPKNQGTFPVVEAADVKVTNTKRLDAALNDKANQSDLAALQTTVAGKASQSDLNALSSTVAGKQNALTEAQLKACNSGITSSLVTQIGTNTTAIAGKASQADLTALEAEVDTKADSDDLTTATANLQSQIDELITPTTQDAEVQNARVGADGTSYQTLKARLDTEFDNTQDNIDIISDVETVTKDGYYEGSANTTTLVVTTNSNHRTVYAECEPNKLYRVTKTPTQRFSVFFTAKFPDTGVATSAITTDNEADKIDVMSPSNAKYICAYVYNANTDSSYGTATEIMDSAAIKEISANDTQCRSDLNVTNGNVASCSDIIHDNFGYINYNYDASFHRAADPEATNSLKIGIDRSSEIVVLNGNSTTNPNNFIIVRITDDVVSTVQDSTVTNWDTGLSLIEGHDYKITCKLLSGTSELNDEEYINSVSVYPIGQRQSVGTFYRSGKTFVRTFTATDTQYNFCIYIEDEQEFVNAKYMITLEDLSENATVLTKDDEKRVFDYFDDITNDESDLVNYGYTYNVDKYPSTDTESSPTYIGVERYGTIIKLNLDNSQRVRRVKISGDIERANSSTFKSWTNTLYLDEGEKYIATIEKISGTGTLDGKAYFPNIVVYDTPIDKTIASWLYESTTKKQFVFTAGSTALSIALYVAEGASLTDLVVRVTLTKADADIEPYYAAEMTDTINKVRNSITSPALVFPIVTDIHRYSENAAVQNFKQMINNISHLALNVKFDFLLNLGDFTDGNTTKEVTFDRAYESTKDFVNIGVPYFWANGNHDINYYTTDQPYEFTMPEVFKAYYGSIKNVVYNRNEYATDYYIDFTIGVRLICLNANGIVDGHERYAYGNSTAAWLEAALVTDNTVIVAVHQSSQPNQVYNTVNTYNGAAINAKLQAFVNNGGNLIMLSGHSHRDIAFIDPWLSVMQDASVLQIQRVKFYRPMQKIHTELLDLSIISCSGEERQERTQKMHGLYAYLNLIQTILISSDSAQELTDISM